MVSLYFSFIHSYLNYGNIAWYNMSITKLKKLTSKQKQTLQTIPMSTIESELRSKQIMKELCILNIYQLNIYNALNLMFKVKKSRYLMLFRTNFT